MYGFLKFNFRRKKRQPVALNSVEVHAGIVGNESLCAEKWFACVQVQLSYVSELTGERYFDAVAKCRRIWVAGNPGNLMFLKMKLCG